MMQSRKKQAGFTLVELVAAVTVMSIVSVVVMPVIGSASESFANTRQIRTTTERISFALDRVTRIVRQAPIGASDTGVGVQSATASMVEFADGTGLRLVGSTLEMLVPGKNPAPLCFGVDSFTIQYLGDDGKTSTLLTPTQTHRFVFTIVSDGIEMSVLAHPRIWVGQ